MLDSTLSWAEIRNREWDVVVIGAGPAGAIAALVLARHGWRVLLVERKTFPRYKVCGGCLSATGVALLTRLGLIDELHHAGAQPLNSLALQSGRRKVKLPLPAGLSLSREVLDALLVRAAIDSGARFSPSTTAEVVAGPAYAIRLQRDAEDPLIIQPRVVAAADGLAHPSLRSLEMFASHVFPRARIGAGTLLDASPGWLEPEQITMVIGASGYVGLVRVENGKTCIAAALDPGFVRASGPLDRCCAEILHQANLPLPAEWADGQWVGTPPLSRRTLPLADRNLFLVGDAAGYVEPFTGEGMTWAMRSAVEVAPYVEQTITGKQVASDWTQHSLRRCEEQSRWCRRLSRSLRSPWLVQASLGALALAPQLARLVIRRLS